MIYLLLDKEKNELKKEDAEKRLEEIFKKLEPKKVEKILNLKLENYFPKEIIQKIFQKKERIEIEEFVVKVLDCQFFLSFLKLIETIIFPFTKEIRENMKFSLYKMPFEFICSQEKEEIPIVIQILCTKMKKLALKEKNSFDFKEFSTTKTENELVEALYNSFNCVNPELIDFSEISMKLIVLTLKKVLLGFPSPLFTQVFSDLLLKYIKQEEINKECLEKIFVGLPLLNRKIISEIVSSLCFIFIGNEELKMEFCEVFVNCFIRTKKNNLELYFNFYLFSNISHLSSFC